MAQYPDPPEDVRVDALAPVVHDDVREVDLDALVTHRTPPRTRAIQVGTLISLLLVVGGLVFHGSHTAQPRPQPQLQPTTTAAPAGISLSDVAVLTNVNYATLTLNGKQLDAHLPAIVTLRQGTNTLTVAAPPFQPHMCTIEWPAVPTIGTAQACGMHVTLPSITIGGRSTLDVFDVPLTVTDLPPAQQDSVRAVVQHALDAMNFDMTVPAQQYIATGVDAVGHITSRLTAESVQARFSLVLDANDHSNQYSIGCPEGLCPSPYDSSPPPASAGRFWTIVAEVMPHWQFTTTAGTLVATSVLPNTTPGQRSLIGGVDITLENTASGSWTAQAAPKYSSPGVASTLDIVSFIQCQVGLSLLLRYDSVDSTRYLVGSQSANANGLNGCPMQRFDQNNRPVARFIWRFGVLLAADAGAQSIVPWLPIAPQPEIDAVS